RARPRRPAPHRPARGRRRPHPPRRRPPHAARRGRPDDPRRPRRRPSSRRRTGHRPRRRAGARPARHRARRAVRTEYAELRKHKGMTMDVARARITDISYFATMMVHAGRADGMVSGAAHTTAHTIRPALEIIRTRPDVETVSSVFFMC